MTDTLNMLASLAQTVYREGARVDVAAWFDQMWSPDPVLRQMRTAANKVALGQMRTSANQPPEWSEQFQESVRRLLETPELASLTPLGDLGTMIRHAWGGMRETTVGIIAGLMSAAFLQVLLLRLPDDEDTFVRSVLENFSKLRKALRGEQIRAYVVKGVSGVRLQDQIRISTPWGVLHPAPPAGDDHSVSAFQAMTTCVLAEERLLTVTLDDAAREIDRAELEDSRVRILFPLACALASEDTSAPAAPIITWSIVLIPFRSGLMFSTSFPAPMKPEVDSSDRASQIEEWSKLIEKAHAPSVDTAARRLVSAVAHRVDPSDALIDAVMAWENLVGAETEVTFRVTAAIAKTLEPDRTKRRQRLKSLKRVYEIRSRLVHGSQVKSSDVHQAAKEAVDVAVQMLRAFYSRGHEWLSLKSHERSDAILLEDSAGGAHYIEPGPGHADIARRAYRICESRGNVDGHALDDWLQAERELKAVS